MRAPHAEADLVRATPPSVFMPRGRDRCSYMLRPRRIISTPLLNQRGSVSFFNRGFTEDFQFHCVSSARAALVADRFRAASRIWSRATIELQNPMLRSAVEKKFPANVMRRGMNCFPRRRRWGVCPCDEMAYPAFCQYDMRIALERSPFAQQLENFFIYVLTRRSPTCNLVSRNRKKFSLPVDNPLGSGYMKG